MTSLQDPSHGGSHDAATGGASMSWWHSAAAQFGLDEASTTSARPVDWTSPTTPAGAPVAPFGFAPPAGAPSLPAPTAPFAPADLPAPVPSVSAESPTLAAPDSVDEPVVAEASLLPPDSEALVTPAADAAPESSIYLALAARVESIESLLASTSAAAGADQPPRDQAAPVAKADPDANADPVATGASAVPAVMPPTQSSFGATLRTLVIVALLAVAGIVATRGSGGDSNEVTVATGVSDGELMVIASDMTVAIQQDAATTNASSAYVRESGVVLMVTTAGLLPSEMSTWLDSLITPFAERLAGLPEGEGLLVAMHFSDAPGFDRLVRMEADGVTDPATWKTVPITGGLPQAMVAENATNGTANGTANGAANGATQTTVAAQESTQTTAAANEGAVTTVPSAEAPVTTAAAAGGTAAGDVVSDDFANGDGQWKSLAGSWAVVDGVYQQTDGLGFDLITRLDKTIPAAYQFEVRMRGIGGAPLNAGILLAQANPGTREGAVVIDLVDNGGYVRWGKYAAVGGAYEFVGGVALEAPLDPAEWHTLKVVVKGETTIVYINDQQIGDAGLVGAGGVGLVVSQSTVEFDDVKVFAV